MPRARPLLSLAAACASTPMAFAQSDTSDARDLTELDLVELMSIEVTSASRKSEQLAEVPAAIFVLTRDDLRKAGVTRLPDALRLVPGLHVAQLDNNRFAISARGFAEEFSNKLLVLIDGRSVYTPLFSGVFWDVQDVLVEDIERIEVIRGPGAVMWGANAVNGVINVLTRSARDTHGSSLSLIQGSETAEVALRHGFAFSPDSDLRVFAKALDHETCELDGDHGDDDGRLQHGGFRSDWRPSDRDQVTFSGDVYGGRMGSTWARALTAAPYFTSSELHTDVSGGNLLARWTRTDDAGAENTLTAWFDSTVRDSLQFTEHRRTYDMEFARSEELGERHDVVWGATARWSESDTREHSVQIAMSDHHRDETILGVFAQDSITLVPDEWVVTLGAKLESYNEVGTALQPSLRVTYSPGAQTRLWAGVSHAKRAASWAEQDVRLLLSVIPGAPDTHVVLLGDDDNGFEELWAFELGARRVLTDAWTLDAALFFNDYEHLLSSIPGTPALQGGVVVQPVHLQDVGEAQSFGFENVLEWRPAAATRVQCALSWIDLETEQSDAEDNAPRTQVRLGATQAWGAAWSSSANLRWIDALDAGDVPSYTSLDARTAWQPTDDLELSLVLLNLFHDGEREFGDSYFAPSNELETAFYVGLRWSR
ncbi:MAG: TonB-dependent receptor [Planctomycetes bacterium]|nr:TonB-dependent receptor [Planctomycetota bacterium]